MIGAALSAVFLFLLLKFGAKEGDSEFSTAALASIFLSLLAVVLFFFISEPFLLLLMLPITAIALKKFCMLAWWKASLFAFLYLGFQLLLAVLFHL